MCDQPTPVLGRACLAQWTKCKGRVAHGAPPLCATHLVSQSAAVSVHAFQLHPHTHTRARAPRGHNPWGDLRARAAVCWGHGVPWVHLRATRAGAANLDIMAKEKEQPCARAKGTPHTGRANSAFSVGRVGRDSLLCACCHVRAGVGASGLLPVAWRDTVCRTTESARARMPRWEGARPGHKRRTRAWCAGCVLPRRTARCPRGHAPPSQRATRQGATGSQVTLHSRQHS